MGNILLTGGGSAGHVTSLVALVSSLESHFDEIHYAGTSVIDQAVMDEVPQVYVHMYTTGKFHRDRDLDALRNLATPFKVAQGLVQADRIVSRTKPDVVFSRGGYAAFPIVFSAARRGIPVVIHESNTTLGLANRMSLPLADIVCTTFKETEGVPPEKTVWTGLPMRDKILRTDKSNARLMLGLLKKSTVLVTSGGSGSRVINSALEGAVERLLDRYNVIHLTGKNFEPLSINHRGYVGIQYADADVMRTVYGAADVMVSRAGANTLNEILYMGMPSVLVPLGKWVSRGDQIGNAEYFRQRGFARVIEEGSLNPERLIEEIDTLSASRHGYAASLRENVLLDATTNVCNLLANYAILK